MSTREEKTIEAFGDEWSRFNQHHLSNREFNIIYDSYFSILPDGCISTEAILADVGAGSGRFADINASKCKELIAFEPSKAATVCKNRLDSHDNAYVLQSTIQDIPKSFEKMFDLVYSLGVLHHTDSIRVSLEKLSTLVKPGGHILLYIYYSFDNRSPLFKAIWMASNNIRLVVSGLPKSLKYIVADILAALVYLPLAKISRLAEKFGFNVSNIPLSTYRKYSFKTMRTDSLDRFGTRIEHRMSKQQLEYELSRNGFTNITFSDNVPYWTVCALKR